jgi:hypothetical protein
VFCPSCRDEFRPGFTHCAACDVDLVEELPGPGAASTPAQGSRRPVQDVIVREQPAVPFCGFLTLDEAMDARGKLKVEGIRSEILIREDEPGPADAAFKDTYWLRLSPTWFKKATAILGHDEVEEEAETEVEMEEGETVACSACGEDVGVDDTSCPHCGASFEET